MATKNVTDLMVVQAYDEYHRVLNATEWNEPCPWPYEILMRRTGECMKVCYRAMERACDKRRLIEYGVSLRTGWLTATGKALLHG